MQEAFQSLEDQILEPNISMHIVVVNDGSTESSTIEFLQNYKSRFQFTLLTNETNIGVAASLNRGIQELPSVDYLFRFDSDDINLPNRF